MYKCLFSAFTALESYTEGPLPFRALTNNEITNNARKMKNRILAMPAAPEAIPPKPNSAAMIATMTAKRPMTGIRKSGMMRKKRAPQTIM